MGTMRYDPDKHHRRSIRLKGYDYSSAGAYFVTICTQDRACLLGDISGEAMSLSEAGSMVQTVWEQAPAYYPGVLVDTLVIMPNHVHSIIVLTGKPSESQPDEGVLAPSDLCLSLSDVVHRLKSLTTTRYADGVRQHGWPAFRGRLWQRNYFERIIRNDRELFRIRQYVVTNPSHWALDSENPLNTRG